MTERRQVRHFAWAATLAGCALIVGGHPEWAWIPYAISGWFFGYSHAVTGGESATGGKNERR